MMKGLSRYVGDGCMLGIGVVGFGEENTSLMQSAWRLWSSEVFPQLSMIELADSEERRCSLFMYSLVFKNYGG